MKNLNILKSLVDFIWYVTCIPLILIIPIATGYIFYDPSIVNLALDITETQLIEKRLWIQLYAIAILIIMLAGIYSFYLFRKTLRFFQKRNPFASEIIKNYYTIGLILIACGLGTLITSFIFRILLTSEIKIDLGISTHLILICLGLFFMVLSELFLVAKIAKEENELTV
jgi:hypothetical protein